MCRVLLAEEREILLFDALAPCSLLREKTMTQIEKQRETETERGTSDEAAAARQRQWTVGKRMTNNSSW